MVLLEKKMDRIEHTPFDHIPAGSLSLRLERPAIKMTHDSSWRIDKVNPSHDLIICLSGGGSYQIGTAAEPIHLRPGEAMLIPAYTRFQGAYSGGTELFTGVAQHFSLELFGRGDLISQLRLKRKVALPDWDVLEPFLRHYRSTAPLGSTTMAQHHKFMVVLLAFIDAAFVDWNSEDTDPQSHDQLSVHIMKVAARLSADPLGEGVDETLDDVPYNPEYFRRAFKDRMGFTPQKFRELKRMEFAASRLGMGLSVKAVAVEMGFADPYFFSRKFKVYMGASPSSFRCKDP